MSLPSDNIYLTHRIYNGLDERKGWPVITLTKPIETINQLPVIPVGVITPRPPKAPKAPTLLERFLNWLVS